MSQLDPELKRLLQWSRQAPRIESTAVPPAGFSDTLVRDWRRHSEAAAPLLWERTIWQSAWAAAALLVAGLALLAAEQLRTGSTYEFSPPYPLVSEFVP
jgi:hypothetical protein